MANIWIARPHYYFTSPLIRRLIKYEERLNAELYKKIQSDKSFVGVFRPVRLFLIYEQLFCMSIQTNGVLRYGQSAYTPSLLADVLDGNFQSSEVEQAMVALEDIGLIHIDEKMTIILTCFTEEIPTTAGSLSAAAADEQVLPEEKEKEQSNFSPYVQLLIKGGYLFEDDSKNRKKSKIQDFEAYFVDIQKKNPKLTDKDLYDMVLLFLKDIKESKTRVESITSKIAYFSKSMEKAISDRNQADIKKSVDSMDYDWPV